MNKKLRKYDELEEAIKNQRISVTYRKSSIIYKTMLSYCLKCSKNAKSKKPRVTKTKKGKLMQNSNKKNQIDYSATYD